jgi:peptidoglycan hydrolase CwlO-like protein
MQLNTHDQSLQSCDRKAELLQAQILDLNDQMKRHTENSIDFQGQFLEKFKVNIDKINNEFTELRNTDAKRANHFELMDGRI